MYYDRLSFLAPILDLRPTQSNLTERETGSDTEPIIDPVAGGEEVAGPSSPPPRSMGQVSSPDHPAPALACGPAPQTPPPGPHPQAGPSAAAPSTIQDDQGNISSRPTAQLQGSPQPAGPSQRGRRRQIPAQDSRTNVDTGSQQSGFLNALKDSPASVLEAVVCFFSMWSIVGLSGFHTYLISSNQTTNEDIKGSWSSKRGKENYNPYSYGNIFTNCCAALCGPMNPSLIDRRGIMEADMAQSVAPSNGLTMYGSTQSQHNMAAATPLLQTELTVTTDEPPLPGKTNISAPCASLALGQPTPPSSMPNLNSETILTDMIPLKEDIGNHQFLTPDEAPSPPGMLPANSPVTHSHTMHVLNLVSQDSLHEDSVRGLVKLSSV
ncbi:palmitoyltransferase ZDHHC14 isoform X3 [Dendrobates tinctorius]|uniref:palmitoyltransferase ZDHHC14 isoform X3 n=1 Tax=Dendrobates tinctorius TaxID=92724 RepID=UPI003CC9399C